MDKKSNIEENIKKGLFAIIGESFRTGGLGSRLIGEERSIREQELASNSHIYFIEFLKKKYGIEIDISLASYSTPYNDILLNIYQKYLVNKSFFNNRLNPDPLISKNRLYCKSLKQIKKDDYDFIFIIRVDLLLKPKLFEIYNPKWKKIMFPSVCWAIFKRGRWHHEVEGHTEFPRVNDMIVYIPQKYYDCQIDISHHGWYFLRKKHTRLTNSNIGVMIKTYHDSNSQEDWNPLYRIVNRKESKKWYSQGIVFNLHNKNNHFMDKSDKSDKTKRQYEDIYQLYIDYRRDLKSKKKPSVANSLI